MAETIIESDLPCEACGYNLRALPLSKRCPECGDPVMKSFESAAMKWEANAIDFGAIGTLAEAIGSTIDAVLFVKDAIGLAMSERRSEADPAESPELDAPGICRAVARYADQYFNDHMEALELLREWKIERSEDVGRIVLALFSARQLIGTADDRLEDFDGLFTLDTLLEEARESCPRIGTNRHE
jgi:uncharacterized repeat protein (TIGR04138 family)